VAIHFVGTFADAPLQAILSHDHLQYAT
jgi:hypothetical protein